MTQPETPALPPYDKRHLVYCSFCGKHQHEVRRVIAGPSNSNICNECVGNCVLILAERDFESLKELVVSLAEAKPQGLDAGIPDDQVAIRAKLLELALFVQSDVLKNHDTG